jgi:hypothetical protein
VLCYDYQPNEKLKMREIIMSNTITYEEVESKIQEIRGEQKSLIEMLLNYTV